MGKKKSTQSLGSICGRALDFESCLKKLVACCGALDFESAKKLMACCGALDFESSKTSALANWLGHSISKVERTSALALWLGHSFFVVSPPISSEGTRNRVPWSKHSFRRLSECPSQLARALDFELSKTSAPQRHATQSTPNG